MVVIVNSQHHNYYGSSPSSNGVHFHHAMGCRQQQQQQQHHGRTKVRVQQQHGQWQPKQLLQRGGDGAGSKMLSYSGIPIETVLSQMAGNGHKNGLLFVPTKQELKSPAFQHNAVGRRSPPKAQLSGPSPSRASPGSLAYAGAKFNAAPPSPHALPKPPISWVNSGNLPTMRCADGSAMINSTADSYGNLISNQLKLMLNVQA